MKYTVENTATQEITTHRTWGAAMRAASKIPDHEVVITEIDRDGSREYNQAGQQLRADGHYR